jgi:hypothetical protein
MQYSVVSENEMGAFLARVTSAMQEGWVLTGGVAVVVIDGVTWYYQAMTSSSSR